MLRNATALLLLVVLLAGTATAQTAVTVKQINEIPQSQIDQLNTLGDAVASSNVNGCGSLIYNSLCNEVVTFTAVVMSDPLNSGLASINSEGRPGRIHVFVRDVTADTEGPEYMGVQIVDGGNLGFDGLIVGDVVQITGRVNPFNTTMQVSPEVAPVVVGSRDPLTDPIFNPIVVTTADLNASAGSNGAIRTNWDNLGKYRGNYVRFEGASAVTRTLGSRADWNWSSDNGTTSVSMYDTSLRYRNDRSDYPSNFNARTNDYAPPTPGATVNVQGFVTFNGGTSSDPYALGVPNGMVVAVNPMSDADVVITASPPAVNNVQLTGGIPSSQAPVTITAEITPDPARTLTGANLVFTTTSNATPQTVAGTAGAGSWSFEISSGLVNEDFVFYHIEATDNTSATTTSVTRSFRVLDNGVTQIAHLQQTPDGQPGDSPFVGQTIDMNITATVTTSGETGIISLQDGSAPWSGIWITSVSGGSNEPAGLVDLRPGDVITVTRAEIEEGFGNPTKFNEDNMAFTLVSTGGAVPDPIVVTTDVLQDAAIAEAHEGLLLRVENPVVTAANADAPSTFGEFAISSDGTSANALRVDDQSSLVSYTGNDPSTVFSEGERLAFVQGALYQSFGNYKLQPSSFSDIGAVTNVATEDMELPETFALHQNYPNPFNPSTSIRFDLGRSANVTLAVYDVLGREVATLVNGQLTPGAHTVSFDASNLTSGVYLYRLSMGAEVLTRTMMLMK